MERLTKIIASTLSPLRTRDSKSKAVLWGDACTKRVVEMQKLTRDTGCSLTLLICLVHLSITCTQISFFFEISLFQHTPACFAGQELATLSLHLAEQPGISEFKSLLPSK